MIFLLKLIVTVIIALIAAILIIVKVRREEQNPFYLLLALVPFAVAMLVMYWLTRMPMRMYLQDFKEVTGVAMPEDAQIIYKSSSIPPTDDHSSLMLVTVGKEFYAALPDLLNKNGLTVGSDTLSTWITGTLAPYGDLHVDWTFQLKKGKLDHSAYLLSDSATILIQRQKFKFNIHGDSDE